MFTVKRYRPEETIVETVYSEKAKLEQKAPRGHNSYVVMKDGQPYFTTNRLTGKPQLEMFKQKSTAQMEADHFNRTRS